MFSVRMHYMRTCIRNEGNLKKYHLRIHSKKIKKAATVAVAAGLFLKTVFYAFAMSGIASTL